MNAVPWPPGPAAPAAPPEDVAAVRLAAPPLAPVSGVLEAILRSTAPCRITLLAAGGGRLPLLAEGGALLAVEGAEGPPAESGKARAARLAALVGGFCAAARAGGSIRARIEALAELPDALPGGGRAVMLPVPPEMLAALSPALPADDGEEEAPAAAPAASATGTAPDAKADAPEAAMDACEGGSPDDPADPLGEALARALGGTQALAAALPGAGIAWVATRAEAAAGGGRLAVRTGGGDEPALLPATGAAEAGAVLDGWIAEALGEALRGARGPEPGEASGEGGAG